MPDGLVVPRVGAATVLEIVLAHTTLPEALVLKLYRIKRMPKDVDTAADFTEPDFFGYAAIPLEPASWRISPGPRTVAEHRPQAFTSTSQQKRQLVYGYFLVGELTNRLYWAEAFPGGPVAMEQRDQQIVVTPRITARPDQGDEDA